LNERLYSTDALRINEGFLPEGSNGAAFGEVLQVLESLWLIHILRYFERRSWLHRLPDIAIFLDGPLAIFGHPAWLSKSVSAEIQRINGLVQFQSNGRSLLIVGIEKSGAFVEHFMNLDRTAGAGFGAVPPRSVLLLSDGYIKRNIRFSMSEKPYGQDTYYGRKFFYKTPKGARIVASTPFLAEADSNMEMAEPRQFARIGDVLALLEGLVSSRFPNALAPIVLAHSEAAIPLNLGKRVLDQLVAEFLSRD
jgi:hypothetical protein